VLADQPLELAEIHVALKGCRLDGRGLVHDHVHEDAAASSWCRRVVVKYMLPGTY